jgi:hypothetical protein
MLSAVKHLAALVVARLFTAVQGSHRGDLKTLRAPRGDIDDLREVLACPLHKSPF